MADKERKYLNKLIFGDLSGFLTENELDKLINLDLDKGIHTHTYRSLTIECRLRRAHS